MLNSCYSKKVASVTQKSILPKNTQSIVYEGHTDVVKVIAMSPDGSYFATAGYDKRIRIWDIRGSLLKTLFGHSRQIESLAISPDGRYIVSGSVDSTAKLWDFATGKELQTMSPIARGGSGYEWICSVAFSPDGKYIVTGGDDYYIKIWNLDGDLQTTIPADSFVEGLAVSPDGKYILANHGSLSLWDFDTGKKVKTYWQDSGAAHSTGFSHDGVGVYFADRSHDKFLVLGEHRQFAVLHPELLEGDYSPNGKYIVTTGRDKKVRLWNSSGTLLKEISTRAAAKSVKFTPDSEYYVYADGENIYLKSVSTVSVSSAKQSPSKKFSDIPAIVSYEGYVPDSDSKLPATTPPALVSSQYIVSELDESQKEPNEKVITFSAGSALIVTEPQGLLVRNGPGQSFKKLGVLKKDTQIEVIEPSEKVETLYKITSHWYKVKHGKKLDKVGWVFGGFLEK
ncbi:MAG: SH3 domain-containing protein [Spirochaetota bacterium]